MKPRIPFCLVLALVCVWLPSRVRGAELRTVLREEASGLRIEYWSGDQSVGRSPDDAPAGIQLRQPGEEWMAVRFRTREERDGAIELGPTEVGGLTLRWRIARKTPSLVERTLEVHAGAARQFAVGFPFETAVAGEFASFTGPVSTRTLFDTVRGSANTETFPVVMLRTEGRVVGLAGDSPGLWENRCQLLLDPAVHRLAVLAGDGRDPYPLVIKPPEDARDTYQYELDADSSTHRQQASLLPPVSAGGEPPDTNYDESKVPPYTLPDPLVCFDGRTVADAAMWRATRRTEILDAFARDVYGRTPAINTRLRCEALAPEAEVFEGLATRRQVRIRLLETDDAPWIDLLLFVPRETIRPAPVFLGLNYGNQGVHPDPGIVPSRNAVCRRGEHARRWPIEWLLKRGYAVASFHGGDLELDRHGSGCQFTIEGWQKGIRSFVLRQSGRTELADDDWGSIGAWAWGLSRALDYLETDAAVDARRVVVFGHSRTGKTALWAGAQDERFALVISNDSGQGGASLARRRYGETVAASYALSGMWYCRNYAAFGNREAALPVDAHLLIGLMAPRPVYVASAELDRWSDPVGEFLAAWHAEPVYALLGCPGLGVAALPEVNRPVGHTIGYHLRSGDHEITLYDWQRYVDFADRHLRPRRVLYNFDGDSCLSTKAGSKGPVPVKADDVRKLIDEVAYPGSRVDTVLVCVNAQVMYYPTQVGTMRGALSSPAERAQWPASEKQRFTNLQAFFDNGVDPYAIMLAEAKRRGREALLTFRMNDDHGNDFLRTQFMVDHPDWRLGSEPYRGKGALDFGRDEVRDYTFRLIEEAVRRYDCDGLELDFNRFPAFFKDGPTQERVVKMNSLVERIRTLLDRVGDERGHRLRLSVRVPSNFGRTPPTPDSAREIGCDVPAWGRRGWIDWVTVSEFLYERGDLPIAAWKQAVTAVPVYGGIECTRGSGQKNLSAEDYRRAAAELVRAGADGVYLFNFFTSREEGPNAYEPPFDVLRDLGVPPSSASAK